MPSLNMIGSGQSTQELALAGWWTRHNLTLRALGYGSLVLFCAISWGFSLWTLLDTYALSYPREKRLPARIASVFIHETANEVTAPRELEMGAVLNLTANGQEQFIAPVNNPNALWWAKIRFRFRDGTIETPIQSTVLLPEGTRFLSELGWNKARMTSPSLSIESVEWKRLPTHLIGNEGYTAYKEKRTQLIADKPRYEGTVTIEEKRLGTSTFLLKNPSGYSYRGVEILTLLYRNDMLVGVQKLVLPRVEAGSEQTIRQTWPDNPVGITRVEPTIFVPLLAKDAFVRP